MKKIPTLFVRDEETNRKFVKNEVNPAAKWVLDGEGVATRKYDGTCVLVRDGKLYKRREVKKGKAAPPDFEEVDHDDETGKTVGWVPVGDGPEDALHRETFDNFIDPLDGTYELCGPKINGNPEGFDRHVFIPHGFRAIDGLHLTFNGLGGYLVSHDFEGIVWHHPDGRMAKLKKRDFPS